MLCSSYHLVTMRAVRFPFSCLAFISIWLFVCLSVCKYVRLYVCLSIHIWPLCRLVLFWKWGKIFFPPAKPLCQFCISVCPPVHLSNCPYVHKSNCQYIHLSICPYFRLSICPYVHQSVCPYLLNFVCPSICSVIVFVFSGVNVWGYVFTLQLSLHFLSAFPSVRLSVRPSVCLSDLFSVCPSFCFSFFLLSHDLLIAWSECLSINHFLSFPILTSFCPSVPVESLRIFFVFVHLSIHLLFWLSVS